MRRWILGGLVALAVIVALVAVGRGWFTRGAEIAVAMTKIDTSGTGAAAGTVTIRKADSGVVLTTDLTGLPAGQHGFHLHTNADCGPGPNDQGQTVEGGAAGGHWDPGGTGQHQGPQGNGHLGDLPLFTVGADGTAKADLTAPRITDLEPLRGRALMIHAGGDNYADQPQPLGGGGGRIACGVIR